MGCKDFEKLLKEVSDGLTKTRIDIYRVKRAEEINNLDFLRNEKNPNNIYNSKIIKGEKEFPMEDKINNIMGNQNSQRERVVQFYRKMPQYVEGATIKIVKDENLETKAGGYNIEFIYKGMLSYAFSGFKN